MEITVIVRNHAAVIMAARGLDDLHWNPQTGACTAIGALALAVADDSPERAFVVDHGDLLPVGLRHLWGPSGIRAQPVSWASSKMCSVMERILAEIAAERCGVRSWRRGVEYLRWLTHSGASAEEIAAVLEPPRAVVPS